MKFNYKFQNLLGTVYRKGDILFTSDGNSVISPVGNKITVYNLKQNKSNTLSVESNYNYTAVDVSPNGSVLLAVNEKGEAQMISLLTCTVIHRYKFKQQVNAVKFSPDGKYFAACCHDTVFIMTAPSSFTGEFRSFVMKRVFKKSLDEVTCLDWSSCSRLLAVGSKDTTTKIYTVDYLDNFSMYSLSGHTDKIVGAFFEKKSLDLITVSRNGQVCLWDASLDLDELVVSEVQISHRKRRKLQKDDDSDDDINEKDVIEKDKENESDEEDKVKVVIKEEDEKRLNYKKLGRHYIGDAIRNAHHRVKISAAHYHKDTKMLITGFSNGVFFLHEMPDVNLIHTLSISEHRISSIAVSPQGDWIAFGCPNIGQLLVWEWQSEQYVMKQQGHSLDMTCLAYSPDGLYIVTGGFDGKVKVWNTTSSFCFVTFSEHQSSVTGIVFSSNKKFFVSSSLDGTVRCYDLTRYRNFRTLTSPSLVQFSCVALDSSSELCCAGGQDVFDIYIWSIKFGKLLEVLGGHEAPVSSLSFSPTLASSKLASASWDKTVRVWNGVDASSECEPIQLTSDALQVVFRPDGEEIAVSTLDGNITFFNATSGDQTGSIEGRNDLGSGRADTDLITPEKMLKTKAFTTICYSADGSCILGGGNSKHVCLYSVKEGILIKKFVITQNRSLDAVNDVINRRLLSEFGNMALVEERTELEGGAAAVRLPGVRAGDMADRAVKPEVRVHCVRFSPTGENFAVAATEGLLVYSQSAGIDGTFRPFRLEMGSTPSAVRQLLKEGSWGPALIGSLQLNEHTVIQECVEAVPTADIELTASTLDAEYTDRLLNSIARLLADSRHLEHLLLWVRALVTGQKTKFPPSVLLALEKVLTVKYSQLGKIIPVELTASSLDAEYTDRLLNSIARLLADSRHLEHLQVIELTASSLDAEYTDRLLNSIARLLADSRHLEHLLLWVRALVTGQKTKFPPSVLLALEKVLTVKYSQLGKIIPVELTASTLDAEYTDRLLNSIARLLADSRHLEHLLLWVRALVTGQKTKFPPSVLLALEKVLTVKYSQLGKIIPVELTASSLDADYTDRLLNSIARLLADSRHLEHLLLWVRALVTGQKTKFPPSVLLALEKVLTVKYSQLGKICDFNKYTIRCIKSVGEIVPKREVVDMDVSDHSSGRGTGSDSD